MHKTKVRPRKNKINWMIFFFFKDKFALTQYTKINKKTLPVCNTSGMETI